MSRSITVAKLAFAAPDGRILFDGLDLTFRAERAGLVGRNGVGKTTLLRLIAGELLPRGGSVTVGGSIAVLRQAVRPRPGETVADLFGGAAALALLRRAEAGDATVAELAEADWTLPARMDAALGRLGLPGLAPETALTRLSGGQGTRAALAALVFAAPDFLLLDEPTNNLDADGRAAVADLLAGWRGGAIVVSHDRALLETMDAIIELTTLGATRHGGGFSAYRAQKEVALAAAGHDLAEAQKRVALLARTARQRAERQQRRDGAGARKAAKGDQPRILLGMMKGRAEATGGANVRLTGKRGADAAADAGAAREKIEVLTPFAVSLPPSGLPPGRMVLEMAEVAAGYDPARPVLSGLALTMAGPERVAVTGPNGSGKTTLLALVTGAMEPFAGTVKVGVPFAFLDQRVSLLDPAASIRDNFRRLNPGADDNACRAALARFMFRADAALQAAGTLSGGQLLRAGLACTLGGPAPPQLLILDEPTNHLDLDAIAAVEAGVRAYDGALLVVSHDAAFLEAVGVTRRVALG